MAAPGTNEEIRDAVRAYILGEFLAGEDPSALTDSTPLVTGRILDSLGSLRLVAFLEDRYGIEIAAHEADADHLDTIARIVDLVRSKL
jgi:acyl carrier protein